MPTNSDLHGLSSGDNDATRKKEDPSKYHDNMIMDERNSDRSDRKRQTDLRSNQKVDEEKYTRKSKRVKVMQESKQTDAERRSLRRLQRSLYRTIAETGSAVAADMEDVGKDAFCRIRKQNNELFSNVRYTREAALDGENIDLISSRAARQVDKLVQVPRYDATRLAHKLRGKCYVSLNSSSSLTAFDWKTLGIECGSCFNSVPTCQVSFLAGPVHQDYHLKERRKRLRRPNVEEKVEEEVAEEVNQKEGHKSSREASSDGNKLSAVEKHMTAIKAKLKHRCKDNWKELLNRIEEKNGSFEEMDEETKKLASRIFKKENERICAIKFLFNPKSFTQTVENIFGLSFLVKKGSASLGVRSEYECEKLNETKLINTEFLPGPWVKRKDEDGIDNDVPETRQAIVSITMKDWKSMVEAFDVIESDIPHRPMPRN